VEGAEGDGEWPRGGRTVREGLGEERVGRGCVGGRGFGCGGGCGGSGGKGVAVGAFGCGLAVRESGRVSCWREAVGCWCPAR
jgi:hypothetical protein